MYCFLKWINSDNGFIQVQCFKLCQSCSKHSGVADEEDDTDINIHNHVHSAPPPYEA